MNLFNAPRDVRPARARPTIFATRWLIVLAFALAVFAPSRDAAAQTYRFDSVAIEGNQRVDAGTVLTYAGISRGQTVSAGELNDAYQRILDSGLFETVRMVPQGNRLLIKVTEFPTISRISFEGNRKIKDEDLEGIVESRSRQVFSPSRAERDAAEISKAYLQSGRIAARVTPKIIRRSENRVDLVFEIFEGKGIEIERVSFVGNKAYSDRRLRRVVESKQAGILRALIARDTFVEDRLAFDRQVLTDFYQSRGYVDFRITGTNAELTRERDAYFVTFNLRGRPAVPVRRHHRDQRDPDRQRRRLPQRPAGEPGDGLFALAGRGRDRADGTAGHPAGRGFPACRATDHPQRPRPDARRGIRAGARPAGLCRAHRHRGQHHHARPRHPAPVQHRRGRPVQPA
ncbi:MAG: hypothetical protein M5U35_08575 [Roseovarius sp.]|nr:hypothetical protein [Roseovarius sp.]